MKNANRKHQKVILEKVDYVPNLVCNLFSLTTALTNDWKTSGNKNGIQIRKGNQEIHFDKKVNGKTGFVFSAMFMTTLDMAMVMMNQERKKMTYKQAHLLLGHPSKEITKATAKKCNWELTMEPQPCIGCQIAKARQKNMNKEATKKSKTPGERLCIDTSMVKRKDQTRLQKYW